MPNPSVAMAPAVRGAAVAHTSAPGPVPTGAVAFVPTAQTHYIRKTGSDANGGSSLAVIQSGTDGVTAGSTFSSATASFSGTDVDELIMLTGIGRYRIVAVTDATTITLSAPAPVSTGITWKEGGTCLTVGALLSAGNEAVREGDTIYVGAGTYRETVTVAVATHNAGVVTVLGDVDGAQTGDSGMVQITAYTTNDKTLPTTASLIKLAGISGLTFRNIVFVSAINVATFATIDGSVMTSQQITFRDCAFLSVAAGGIGGNFIFQVAYGIPLGLTIDRCISYKNGNTNLTIQWTSLASGAETNLNIAITNSIIHGIVSVQRLQSSTTGAGGTAIRNCSILASGAGSVTALSLANASLTYPSAVDNCLIIAYGNTSTGMTTTTLGSVTEDYNVIVAATPRTNINVGVHSISDGSYAPLFHLGQEQFWGGFLQPFGEPMAGSPLAGFGNDASQTAYDMFNRPRPAGGGNSLPAVGALERGNSFAKETGTVHTGSNAISAIGAAYQDFLLPVTSGVTYTPSIYSNRDGSYTGTNPQIAVVNGGECGVADQTVTAGGVASSWVQISLGSFVPTADGIVTIRLLANDTSGVAETVFDTFAAI